MDSVGTILGLDIPCSPFPSITFGGEPVCGVVDNLALVLVGKDTSRGSLIWSSTPPFKTSTSPSFPFSFSPDSLELNREVLGIPALVASFSPSESSKRLSCLGGGVLAILAGQ